MPDPVDPTGAAGGAGYPTQDPVSVPGSIAGAGGLDPATLGYLNFMDRWGGGFGPGGMAQGPMASTGAVEGQAQYAAGAPGGGGVPQTGGTGSAQGGFGGPEQPSLQSMMGWPPGLSPIQMGGAQGGRDANSGYPDPGAGGGASMGDQWFSIAGGDPGRLGWTPIGDPRRNQWQHAGTQISGRGDGTFQVDQSANPSLRAMTLPPGYNDPRRYFQYGRHLIDTGSMGYKTGKPADQGWQPDPSGSNISVISAGGPGGPEGGYPMSQGTAAVRSYFFPGQVDKPVSEGGYYY